jgi:hypothetical protein
LAGYPPTRVHLGPFEGARDGARMRWRWVGPRWARPELLAGVALDQERGSASGVRLRSALGTAAGPGAQVVVVASLALVAAAGGGLPFWIAAGVVAGETLIELVPIHPHLSGDFEAWSDGMWLWRWLTAPAATSARTACVALSTALRRERRRPRDVSDQWVSLALVAEPTTGELVTGRLLALGAEDGWHATQFLDALAIGAICLAASRPEDALIMCDGLLAAPWVDGGGPDAMLREQVVGLPAEAAARIRGTRAKALARAGRRGKAVRDERPPG